MLVGATRFDAYYASTARRPLSLAYALTGNWGDAEDLVPDAYSAGPCRGRHWWPTVLLGIGRLRTSRSDGGPGPDLSDTTEQERLDTGGHTVVCGKEADGLRRCFVTVGSTIVRSHSRGVAFADIARSER